MFSDNSSCESEMIDNQHAQLEGSIRVDNSRLLQSHEATQQSFEYTTDGEILSHSHNIYAQQHTSRNRYQTSV